MEIHVYMQAYIYLRMHTNTYIDMHIYRHTSIHLYIYVYIAIHMYIHIYKYICAWWTIQATKFGKTHADSFFSFVFSTEIWQQTIYIWIYIYAHNFANQARQWGAGVKVNVPQENLLRSKPQENFGSGIQYLHPGTTKKEQESCEETMKR